MKYRELEEIQKEIDLVEKKIKYVESHESDGASILRLIAVSVLALVFVASVSLFGG